ncbi:BSD domain-containing protein 1-like isoform X2 [Chiloscyllium plagiosum]|uniref:BSD domain-containing protein 1-like isoform X2 n=1 Tax=Chiloscyllium plagiosum TaxID=36176 RepID=UPI001CB8712A|nr:BSD domain-containing protein 1-like isoform X2 [Chiloscyllium plagiosum]
MTNRWWGGWIKQNIATAKAKVEEHTEGGQVFSKGLSNLLGVISDAFAPTVEESVTSDIQAVNDYQMRISEPYDSLKARLCNLQVDPATYSMKPDEQYNSWLLSFTLADEKCIISDLLDNNPPIRDLYAKLVPSEITHSDFWSRYFYRVHQLHQEEARRTALKQRAEQSTYSVDLKWEDDEDEWNDTSLSAFKPKDLNMVTNDRYELPGNKMEETGSRVAVSVLSDNASDEIQPLALLSIGDTPGIQLKHHPAGETIQILESGLEIEKKLENKMVLKEDLCDKLFGDEGISTGGEDSPGFEESLMSTLERNHDRLHLQSEIAKNTSINLNSNVEDSAFLGIKGFRHYWTTRGVQSLPVCSEVATPVNVQRKVQPCHKKVTHVRTLLHQEGYTCEDPAAFQKVSATIFSMLSHTLPMHPSPTKAHGLPFLPLPAAFSSIYTNTTTSHFSCASISVLASPGEAASNRAEMAKTADRWDSDIHLLNPDQERILA